MSHIKNIAGCKSQVQDPEAILSMENILENDENVTDPSYHELANTSGIPDMYYENLLESTNTKKFEYPIVTINGKPTLESKTTMNPNASSLISSKVHALSEPDLTNANLYSNRKDLLSPVNMKHQDASQRKKHQKIDARRGKKIDDISCVLENDSSKNDDMQTTERRLSTGGESSGKSSINMRYNRIFKKTSQDGNLILFLPQRELTVTEEGVEPLMGVALIHESILKKTEIKVFLQIVLIFRYGRDDEELLGLRFCNEVVVAADQIHPPPDRQEIRDDSTSKLNKNEEKGKVTGPPVHLSKEETSNKGDVFIKNTHKMESSVKPTNQKIHPTVLANAQGFIAIPFVVNIGTSAPPSVRLIPCRPYSGAPIGTTYEVQLFTGTHPEEIPTNRRKMVSMSLRIMESLPKELPPKADVFLEKRSLISGISGNDFALVIRAQLDSAVYTENDKILIRLMITKRRQRQNKSIDEDDESSGHGNGHGVRKIKITAIQQVGIALFSSGNFKNCLGNVIIKSDASASRNLTSVPPADTLEPNIGTTNKLSINPPKGTRRRYSLMPLPSIFRGNSATHTKEEAEINTGTEELNADPKPPTNFKALRTFMSSKGRKNIDASDEREAVYATRPISKRNRRHSCMPPGHKVISPEKSTVSETKIDTKEEADDEENNVLTDFNLEPSEETFSEDIPLKIALDKDYSWAAMDDTSKKVSELTHLAPTVYHANKALFIVRVSYFVQVVVFYGLLKRSVTLKLPFILTRPNPEAISSLKNLDDPKTIEKASSEIKTTLEVPEPKEEKNHTNSGEGLNKMNKNEVNDHAV